MQWVAKSIHSHLQKIEKEEGKRKKTKKMMYFQSRSAIFSNKQT
jgi:hypothetical protein